MIIACLSEYYVVLVRNCEDLTGTASAITARGPDIRISNRSTLLLSLYPHHPRLPCLQLHIAETRNAPPFAIHSMHSISLQPPTPSYGDKREPTPLTPSAIAQARDRSPDNGHTLVLSKLNLSDVSPDAAEELATIGRKGPDDECIIERCVVRAVGPRGHDLTSMRQGNSRE